MNYFTPELYLRYNASDEQDADTAAIDWERAIEQYKRYLKAHRNHMPPAVRALAEKCCFHDAVLLGRQSHEQISSGNCAARRVMTLGLQHGNEMIVLYYMLAGSPRESKRRKRWPFSNEGKHWLYDEVEVDADMRRDAFNFAHRILWSDGSESKISFSDVIVDRFPALNPALAPIA